MKNENASVRGTKRKTVKRSRWQRDADGKYRYRGICPFNRAVCALRNIIVARGGTDQ